jgi:hypothetical protein
MTESDILLTTGGLAIIGGIFFPMIMSLVFDFQSEYPHWRKWVMIVAGFMMLPFVWRVWLLAVVG